MSNKVSLAKIPPSLGASDLCNFTFTCSGTQRTADLTQTSLAGRTHQLRVHCSALGHPIVGDLTYGQSVGQEERPFRMMLHAFYLRIPMPNELVEACTPDPFLPALDACWQPQKLFRPLDPLVQALRAAPDPEPTDEHLQPPQPSSPPLVRTRLPETEEQRASRLQWLAEWTLEPDN